MIEFVLGLCLGIFLYKWVQISYKFDLEFYKAEAERYKNLYREENRILRGILLKEKK